MIASAMLPPASDRRPDQANTAYSRQSHLGASVTAFARAAEFERDQVVLLVARRFAADPIAVLAHLLELERVRVARGVAGSAESPGFHGESSLAERLLDVRDWRALEHAYEALDRRSQTVLDLGHGLHPSRPARLTWQEIAERIGVSRTRVQELHAAAVAKLNDLLWHNAERPVLPRSVTDELR
jgi:hypothetical protein